MRIIAFDRFRPGVTLKTIEPYLALFRSDVDVNEPDDRTTVRKAM